MLGPGREHERAVGVDCAPASSKCCYSLQRPLPTPTGARTRKTKITTAKLLFKCLPTYARQQAARLYTERTGGMALAPADRRSAPPVGERGEAPSRTGRPAPAAHTHMSITHASPVHGTYRFTMCTHGGRGNMPATYTRTADAHGAPDGSVHHTHAVGIPRSSHTKRGPCRSESAQCWASFAKASLAPALPYPLC